MKKRVGCNGRSQKLKIFSVRKIVKKKKKKKKSEVGGGVMYNKTIYVTYTKYYIIVYL